MKLRLLPVPNFRQKSFAEAKDYFLAGAEGLEPQHPVLETGALPIELRP